MRVGSLVYAVEQGLGILAKSFFDAGVVTNVAVVRHGRRPEQTSWYPGAPRIGSLKDRLVRDFCSSMDVMLFFETPFDWALIPYCRERGVKTVLMPMHECTPDPLPYVPDEFFCPSHLDYDCFGGQHIPVPVKVPWKLRTRVETFVHNAGYGGLRGRNGTHELFLALRHIRSPAKLIVRTQDPGWQRSPWRGVDVRVGTAPYEELFAEGDAFLFPEKFNGLSLPLQEARAAGMLVVATDRHPMNKWLPRAPLIPVHEYQTQRVAPRFRTYEEAIVRPEDIAATVDRLYDTDIAAYSLGGKAYAEQHSWELLKPKYMEALQCVCST